MVIVLLFLKSVADSEDMPIRVTHVHLAYAPRHVGWRPDLFESLREAVLIDRLDVINEDRRARQGRQRLV